MSESPPLSPWQKVVKLCSDFGGIAGVVSLALNTASWVYGVIPGTLALPLAGAFGMLTVLGIVARVYVSNGQPIDTGSLFQGVPIPWHRTMGNLALLDPAHNAAPLKQKENQTRSVSKANEDVVQERGEYFELKKLEPNFTESTLENLAAHSDENGIIVRGDGGKIETFRAYVVPYSNYSNIRKIAPAEKVSTRLTYVCFVGDGPKHLMIDQGAWLSEKDSELDFPMNSTPRRAIIATAEGESNRVYAIRRDDSDYKGTMMIREELYGEVFSVHVSILSNSRRVTAKNFVYILEVFRSPDFELRLTNAVLWKSEHLHNFVRESFAFSERLHEIWRDANSQVPLGPPTLAEPPTLANMLISSSRPIDKIDLPGSLAQIRAIEREQEEPLIEGIKDWETRAADFVGLCINAEQRDKFKKSMPSIEQGFNREQKSFNYRIRLTPKGPPPPPDLPYWTLSDAVSSRRDVLMKIVGQLR